MKKCFKSEKVWLSYNDMPAKTLLHKCEEFIGQEDYFDEKSSRILKRKKVSIYDPVVELGKYEVSDFLLENLIACGAIQNLKTVQYSDTDVDLVCDQLERAGDYVDYLVEKSNLEANENTPVEQ